MSDAQAIRLLDRLLAQDLWIEWVWRSMQRFGPKPEILATSSNPPKAELERQRYELAESIVHRQARVERIDLNQAYGRNGLPIYLEAAQ
jgi:hypothetical protein